MIHRLVYSSRCADGVGEADVRDILETARRENAKTDITDILFLVNNEFLQVLEGPLSVYGLFDRISKDPRHHSVELHVEEETPNRYFSQWSMAYALLDDKQTKRIGGSFNLSSAAEFISYLKRPDAYLSEIFKSIITDIQRQAKEG